MRTQLGYYTLLALCNSGHIEFILLWKPSLKLERKGLLPGVLGFSRNVTSVSRFTKVLERRGLLPGVLGVSRNVTVVSRSTKEILANLLYHNTALPKKRCIGLFHRLNKSGSPSTQFWILANFGSPLWPQVVLKHVESELYITLSILSLLTQISLHFPFIIQVNSRWRGLRQILLLSRVHQVLNL